MLACLGEVIRESVRESTDVGFRFGGDEFGVVFRDIEHADCLKACDRIRCRFAAANGYGCTVSIGLKDWSADMGPEVSVLVRACDAYLYRAKDLGGDHVVCARSAAPAPADGVSPPPC